MCSSGYATRSEDKPEFHYILQDPPFKMPRFEGFDGVNTQALVSVSVDYLEQQAANLLLVGSAEAGKYVGASWHYIDRMTVRWWRHERRTFAYKVFSWLWSWFLCLLTFGKREPFDQSIFVGGRVWREWFMFASYPWQLIARGMRGLIRKNLVHYRIEQIDGVKIHMYYPMPELVKRLHGAPRPAN